MQNVPDLLQDNPGHPPSLYARAGQAPLSFAQQRLWFLNQIYPADISANISHAVRITGALNIDALRQALQAIVARHESLRTRFAKTEIDAGFDSQPHQLIATKGSVQFDVTSLFALTGQEPEQTVKQVARAEAQRPFDLTLGPLIRLKLLSLNELDHVLLLNTHRIICDDFSARIFSAELWEFYRAILSREPARLGELPFQYADYAVWERERLQGETLVKEIDYWKGRLAGAPAAIQLPTDHPRPAVLSWRGNYVATVVERTLTDCLRRLSEGEQTTLFTVLLATFQVLLSYYSKQNDIVVGSTIANRDREETQKLLGPLANALPLRTDLSGNPVFRELLARLHRSVIEARARLMPFERLVDEFPVERTLSHTPIFQVMLNLRSEENVFLDEAGLRVETLALETGISRFDLTLDVVEEPAQLNCRLVYNSDLFDEATISRMLGQWHTLLEAVATNPNRPIACLPLLTEAERRQIVIEWNNTQANLPLHHCVTELFEEQVLKMPAATAVISNDSQLSYSELNRRANQVAHFLRRRGIGPNACVGLCMRRSPEMVISLLGILKAGAAYVPLNPRHPLSRLALQLSESQAKVCLTNDKAIAESLKFDGETIDLKRDDELLLCEPTTNPLSITNPDDLVYVIYTSGSTGVPKGVALQHRNLINYVQFILQRLQVNQPLNFATVSTFTADLCNTCIFPALLSGGCLHILMLDEAIDGTLFSDYLSRHPIDVLKIVPSHLQVLLASSKGNILPSKYLVLGGEALSWELADRLSSMTHTCEIINEYGPTETTVGSLTFSLSDEDSRYGQTVPIGRPIANTRVYIADESLRLVPLGVPGELYIGGAGVAAGYLNLLGETAKRFVPDPFSGDEGSRLYRTGDLARYLADGNIEFLGRVDQQVKVRGYRVELQEIEAVLLEDPEIREAVVVMGRKNEEERLVAYLTTHGLELPSQVELRRLLKQKLPDYMIPSAFVMLESMPLTSNGKIDRGALPEPDETRPDLAQSYLAPRDKIEEQVAMIWAKVLGLKSVGVSDNFFDLGGHSLQAARLFAQIENRFGQSLPLSTLFQAPTIQQLAGQLRSSRSTGRWSSLVTIQPNGDRPPLFCVHAGGANVLIYRPLARHLGTERPVYALQAQGLDGQTVPYRRVEDMADHYIKEMRSLQPNGPYFLLGASFGGLVVFEMANQLLAQGEKVALLCMLNTDCPVSPGVHRLRRYLFRLVRRLHSHLSELRQRGLKFYVRGRKRSLTSKLRSKLARPETHEVKDAELRTILESREDRDDPLVRTIFGIWEASRKYQPTVKSFPGKITFFWANDDPVKNFEDNRLGWRRLSTGGFEVQSVPGTHTSIREEPNVAVLAEKLQLCLQKAHGLM
ncbi:MAG: amino acid adenylation domain-containing protein [Acidobacteriota bacterium]